MGTKVICLTGGIGSGKSLVSRILMSMGIPVYYADERAKAIYNEQKDLKDELRAIFGQEVVDQNGKVDRKVLSDLVFNDKYKLQQLNNLVHPRVKKDYLNWLEQHKNSTILCREVAILFESGTEANCDFIVAVNAPEKIRLERVMARDGSNAPEVLARMANQWTDEQRSSKSHFTITNDRQTLLLPQINKMFLALSLGHNISNSNF